MYNGIRFVEVAVLVVGVAVLVVGDVRVVGVVLDVDVAGCWGCSCLLFSAMCGTLTPRSQTRHTQHQIFGYTTTLTANKLPTCIS
jgi:hypothetical protein